MTTGVKVGIGVVVVAVVGAFVYPNVKASMVRSQATARIEAAEAARVQAPSPVAKMQLADAIMSLQLMLRTPETTTSAIAEADAALGALMEQLKTSPPPARPLVADPVFPAEARAGQMLPVQVNVRCEIDEAFLVRVSAHLESDAGWKSEEITRPQGKAVGRDGVRDVKFEFPLPKDASGKVWVHTTIAFRMNPTGEGQEFRDPARAGTPVTIVR